MASSQLTVLLTLDQITNSFYPIDPSLPPEPLHIIYNDPTVPPFSDLQNFWNDGEEWLHAVRDYPEHTRFVHRALHPHGLLAYALSLRGAQKLLYYMSILGLPYAVDNAVAEYCFHGALECWAVSP